MEWYSYFVTIPKPAPARLAAWRAANTGNILARYGLVYAALEAERESSIQLDLPENTDRENAA